MGPPKHSTEIRLKYGTGLAITPSRKADTESAQTKTKRHQGDEQWV